MVAMVSETDFMKNMCTAVRLPVTAVLRDKSEINIFPDKNVHSNC